jgi:hypothetical protein
MIKRPTCDFQHMPLTGMAESPQSIMMKLHFNGTVFRKFLGAPDSGISQGYAFLDYALTTTIVHAWACDIAEVMGKDRGLFSAQIKRRIRWWHELRFVANAMKHVHVEQPEWPGGYHGYALFTCAADGQVIELNLRDIGVAASQDAEERGEMWWEAVIGSDTAERTRGSVVVAESFADWREQIDALLSDNWNFEVNRTDFGGRSSLLPDLPSGPPRACV